MAEAITLELVGGFSLRGAGGAVLPAPGRRAGALLAYLALEPSRAHSRDSLAALLWPEAGPAEARAALRQALHALRRALGPAAGAIEADGAALRLAPSGLPCDAAALENATADADALRRLRASWRGELLAGSAPAGAAHEAWLETRRRTFAERLARAYRGLLESDLEAARWDEALATARRLAAVDPLDETAALGAMRALAGGGDRPGALRVHDALAERLRAALAADPGPELADLARRLRRPPSPSIARAAHAAPDAADAAPVVLLCVHVAAEARGAARRAALDAVAAAARAAGGVETARRPDALYAAFGGEGLRAAHLVAAAAAAADAVQGSAEPARAALTVATLRDGGGERPPWICAADTAEADRLAATTAPGEVLAHPSLARLDGAERLRLAAVVDGAGMRALRLGGVALAPDGGDMVGRVAERAQLVAAARAVAAEGGARVVALRGEPGAGKSRLIAAAQATLRAAHGFRTVTVTPPTGALAAEGALLRALTAALGCGECRADAADAHGRAALRRDHAAAAIRAASGPLCIALEDFERAAPADAAELAALVVALADAPALWLAATRRGEGAADLLLDGVAGRAPVATLDLAPLSDAEARAMAARSGLDPARQAACVARARGNPLFLSQLLRHADEGPDAPPPPSVLGAVAARLDRIGAAARALLRATAVLGDATTAQAALALSATGPEALREATGRGLLVADGDRLAFEHPLVREGVLAATPGEARERLHARAARIAGAARPAARARHLLAARDPQAADALRVAAAAERAAGRYADAVALAEGGRALRPPPRLAAALALEAGRALLALGEPGRAFEALGDAVALDGGAAVEATLARAAACRALDRLDDGLAMVDAAEAALRPHDHALRAEAALTRSRLAFAQGRPDSVEAAAAEALEAARLAAAPALQAAAFGGLADAAYAGARLRSATARLEESLALCARHRLDREALAQQSLRVHLHIYRGRLRGALDDAAAGAAQARAIGAWRAEINLLLGVAAAAFSLERLDRCADAAEAAAARAAATGARRFDVVAALYLARIRLVSGDTAAARALIERARDGAAATSAAVYGAQVEALAACAAETPEAAQDALEGGARLLAAGAISHNALRFHPNAGLVALRHGDAEQAVGAARRLEAVTATEPIAWSRLHASALRAAVAADAGASARTARIAGRLGFTVLARLCGGARPRVIA
ncbi:BTAD domain-containing putative transcriptional regulator [Rubrimonas cliftonensis]|uniref:DNA-binding transcriptional activator of the SARP family n=1 Tax=Rubrimonas cliftonensis TaxID=89524 RepID=A0A1H4AJB5_9RHOB|nr:BTAD domain-containing putative transcriptional regulator [Rubrimonas cliftonensis]SEA35722.1 DNA-binding transcriptional activator of the SARP family [Rubrimonas cliftonensis]